MGRLDGKVAVVTGGANGIGRACCERFAEEGADVVVADVSDDAGAETVALVEKLGRRAVYVRCDAPAPPTTTRSWRARSRRPSAVSTSSSPRRASPTPPYESGNMQKEYRVRRRAR